MITHIYMILFSVYSYKIIENYQQIILPVNTSWNVLKTFPTELDASQMYSPPSFICTFRMRITPESTWILDETFMSEAPAGEIISLVEEDVIMIL